eukprot:TRINITY_DN32063_c0_g1_i5.p1 TRINITY_DN32063_c0_g1~~TRINITY_DN32063_c0_g1_i5.p1  ORF type:complete len:208 (-),score=24.07 TRINITY_DN32063_c0_g1_i5:289-867(-)
MTVTVSTGTLLPGTPSQPGRRRRALRILPHNGASYVTRLLLGGTLTSAALQRSYAAAPGNLPTCKNFAQAQCFDQQYTCDRCCDTRAIPTGDMSCWLNEIEFALCCGVTQMRMQAQAMLPPVHVEGKATCPPAAMPHCFDKYFTCERCCDTRRGPQGDMACWPDLSPMGMRTLDYNFCCGLLPFHGAQKTNW